MYGKQMELFNDGGLKDEGGMVDEMSGNDVPPGSTRKEVRDDIPAMLSEGEFVFPADVVRYFGLERLMEMRQQAKMGLRKMEEMGQMGNSEEATIPDDLPFSPEDLIIMMPQEYNRGGVVKAQQGVFVQPSGFQDSSLNTPNFIPPSSIAPVNPQGTPTGYLPSFVNQSVIVPTGQNETIIPLGGTDSTISTDTTGTDFVPTVDDVYTFVKYINNETGEIRDFPFYMGQPVTPIPDGFVPYVEEETTATEDVTDVGTETTQMLQDNDEGGGFNPTTGEPTGQQAIPVGEFTDEDLLSTLARSQTIARAGTIIGGVINPAIGVVVAVAAKARYNDLLEEAQRRGLDTDGRERMGSVFGGEAGIYEGLQDQNGDNKISFADTWLGDLLGLDGQAGVQGPGLQESRRGARRGATTTPTDRARTGTGTGTSGSGAVSTSPTARAPTISKVPTARPESPGVAPQPTPITPDRKFGTFTPEGIVVGTAQAARPGLGAKQAIPITRDDNDNDSSDMFSDRESRAESARKAAESSRSGRDEVLGGIAERGREQGKSATQITNEVAAAARESSKVEGALKDISRGVQRGFNQGGLAARKQTTNNKPINKDRGVAARKKK